MNPRLAALDFITACLGVRSEAEIGNTLHSAVASGHLNWHTVIEISNTDLVTPALWVALRNKGLVERLPSDVREYLRELHRLNTLRNEHLRTQLIEAIRQLNSIGIKPVVLKGAASFFVKIFDDPGSRVMVDLDILVPQKAAEDCWNILHILGYSPANKDYDYSHHHHLRPLYRPGDYGAIEIHRDVLPNSTARLLPTQLVGRNIEAIQESDIELSIPTPTFRILHNLLHSSLVDEKYGRGEIALRSLHELVMMQAVYNQRIDWETIRQLMDRGGQAKVLHASLYLAHRLFGSPMPDRIGPTFRAIAHYARTRLQFRWNWTNKLVDRASWFSTQSIRERYNCDNNFWSVAKGRIRLAAFLFGKYSSQIFRLIGRRIRKGRARTQTSA